MSSGPSYTQAPQHGYTQDMPPRGGYAAIKYKRNLPIKGPSGIVIFAGVTALSAYGFYKVILGNWEKRELKREATWSRFHLVPVILAEQDRDAYRRKQAALAKESVIMEGVEGWEVGKSVYNTKRYTPTSIVVD